MNKRPNLITFLHITGALGWEADAKCQQRKIKKSFPDF